MGRKVDVTITYLEQKARPALPDAPQPRGQHALLRALDPPLAYYRYLYSAVGDSYYWVSRKRLDDAQLRAITSDPNVHICVLYVAGSPAGFTELDHREANEVEVKFFGLTPDHSGRGLGRYFLTQTIDLAWGLGPRRVRLETCTLDHPAALPLYQKLGFTVYDQRRGVVDVEPEDDAAAERARGAAGASARGTSA